VTIASLVACWQPLSALCFLCSPVNKSTANHLHNTLNNPKYYLHLEYFASIPTSSEWYHLLRTNCCYSPNTEYGIEPLLWTLFIPAHSSEWHTYFQQMAAIAPIWILNPYFEPFASLPTVQNGTFRTICCHIPNKNFELLLWTLCIPVRSSKWYTCFAQIAAISPIRILSPYFEHFASLPTVQNGTFRTICCHIPNKNFELLLWTLCIPAHSSEWHTCFAQIAAISPIRILSPYFEHFAYLPTAQNGTLTSNHLLP
jgi:hypothetical protein